MSHPEESRSCSPRKGKKYPATDEGPLSFDNISQQGNISWRIEIMVPISAILCKKDLRTILLQRFVYPYVYLSPAK
jgi:hypothetical protein